MNKRHIAILRHALGIANGKKPYRNHFTTGPGSKDFADCEELVAEGLMWRREPSELTGGDFTYHVTDAGRELAEEGGMTTQQRPDTYKLRVNKNGQYIDIVPADAGPGAGCIARIPIRCGFDALAFDRATLICAFLNEHQAGMLPAHDAETRWQQC